MTKQLIDSNNRPPISVFEERRYRLVLVHPSAGLIGAVAALLI